MYYSNKIQNILTEDVKINFAKALVHEVKNPVSLIKAHIEFLELDTNLYVYKNNLDMIKKELNKISEIISNFLSYDNKEKIKEAINIIPFIKENIKMLDIYKNNIDISFELNCDIKHFYVKSDPLKIYILFSNILKNAIESIENNGNIKILLYLKSNVPTIDIIDNGKGLPECTDVYKPYVTNKKYGTGIGLSICKNIVKSIGGNFEIFNNHNNGCTARITL